MRSMYVIIIDVVCVAKVTKITTCKLIILNLFQKVELIIYAIFKLYVKIVIKKKGTNTKVRGTHIEIRYIP